MLKHSVASTQQSTPPETVLAFFLIAVAYKTPWTAISSLLGQLAVEHGPHSLLALNLCYFLPPMPLLWMMSVMQVCVPQRLACCVTTRTFARITCSLPCWLTTVVPTPPITNHQLPKQARLERTLGVRRSALLRLTLGLGSLSALSLLFPRAAAAHGMRGLMICTACIGAAYSIAFGTSYELAPTFGPSCQIALTAGDWDSRAVELLWLQLQCLLLLLQTQTPAHA